MGDWTYEAGEVLVQARDEHAGVLVCAKKGFKIIFGSHHLKGKDGENNVPRIDMTKQSHDNFDQMDPTIGCFITAADLIHAELTTHKTVIINCANGNSRTGHALIAYLVRYEKMDIHEATKLVVEAQAARGMKFDPHQTKSANNYFKWMESSLGRIQDTSNSVNNRGMYSNSGLVDGGNKSLHFIMHNKSAPLLQPPVQAIAQPSVQANSSTGPWMPIGAAEVRDLNANATVYLGYRK